MGALITGNRVAASLAPPDTLSCLQDLERLAPKIGMAEIRLDLMRAFDIEKLVASSPVPLILTCRPTRERGGYAGSERERLAILRTAYECECAYIDVEADCLDSVSGWRGSATQIIASQHWFDRMPADLSDQYLDLRDRCAVVKLVGTAHSATDVLPVLELLHDATTPVIGMAMGRPGTCTRIMSPVFPHSLLTYGSATMADHTAPGQITVDEMVNLYALHLVNADTRVYVHIISTDRQDREVLRAQERAVPGAELHVSLRTPDADAPPLAARLTETLPPGPFTIL
jgi:3-dehydroquinate dehydratase type I